MLSNVSCYNKAIWFDGHTLTVLKKAHEFLGKGCKIPKLEDGPAVTVFRTCMYTNKGFERTEPQI